MAHYAVSFRRSAEKDLRKLDSGVRRRVPDVIRNGRNCDLGAFFFVWFEH